MIMVNFRHFVTTFLFFQIFICGNVFSLPLDTYIGNARKLRLFYAPSGENKLVVNSDDGVCKIHLKKTGWFEFYEKINEAAVSQCIHDTFLNLVAADKVNIMSEMIPAINRIRDHYTHLPDFQSRLTETKDQMFDMVSLRIPATEGEVSIIDVGHTDAVGLVTSESFLLNMRLWRKTPGVFQTDRNAVESEVVKGHFPEQINLFNEYIESFRESRSDYILVHRIANHEIADSVQQDLNPVTRPKISSRQITAANVERYLNDGNFILRSWGDRKKHISLQTREEYLSAYSERVNFFFEKVKWGAIEEDMMVPPDAFMIGEVGEEEIRKINYRCRKLKENIKNMGPRIGKHSLDATVSSGSAVIATALSPEKKEADYQLDLEIDKEEHSLNDYMRDLTLVGAAAMAGAVGGGMPAAIVGAFHGAWLADCKLHRDARKKHGFLNITSRKTNLDLFKDFRGCKVRFDSRDEKPEVDDLEASQDGCVSDKIMEIRMKTLRTMKSVGIRLGILSIHIPRDQRIGDVYGAGEYRISEQ